MARNEKNTRMCSGCRERKNRSELVRVYKTKDGIFGTDRSDKSCGGRGVYVCFDVKCIENAQKRKSFSRSFKCDVPPDIIEELINIVKTPDSE